MYTAVAPTLYDGTLVRRYYVDAMTLEKYSHAIMLFVEAGIVRSLRVAELLLVGLHEYLLVGLPDRGETEAILLCDELGLLRIAVVDDERICPSSRIIESYEIP
jgi:hypothetical protein